MLDHFALVKLLVAFGLHLLSKLDGVIFSQSLGQRGTLVPHLVGLQLRGMVRLFGRVR